MKEVHLTPFQSFGRTVRRIGCTGLDPLDMADVLNMAGRAVAATTGKSAGNANHQAEQKTTEMLHSVGNQTRN